MTVFTPAQCTEREPGSWEDCTWASGVMLQNLAHGANVVPSTRAEYEALRVAGGDGPAENPGDGSNVAQLVIGMLRRYGWQPRRVGPPGFPKASWADVLNGLAKVGAGAVVQGSMGAWSRDSHWRRWDPNFAGGHAMFVERVDTRDRVWLQNPLAPATYPGEFMPMADLKAFYDAFYGGLAFAQLGQQSPPKVHIARGATIRVYALGTKVVDGQLCIASYKDIPWGRGPSQAAALSGEVHRKTCDGKSGAYTVRVKSALAEVNGHWIQTRANGVTYS